MNIFFFKTPLLILGCILAFSSCTRDRESLAQNECAEGKGEGCRTLGEIYLERGDRKKAKSYYLTSCDTGFTIGCNAFAELAFADGEIDLALAKFKYSCDRGNSAACVRHLEVLKSTRK